MNRELESIIKDDIERCKKLTTVAGSVELFQALASKYNGYFPGFYDEIIVEGSLTPDGDRDYRPEVHAVQEKLELAILAEHEKDPIYDFRKMLILISWKTYAMPVLRMKLKSKICTRRLLPDTTRTSHS